MSIPPCPQTPFQYTEPANPSWTWAQGVESTPEGKAWADGEKEGWKVIDTSKEDRSQLYKLMISGIVPRPVAYVSSISENGIENLAPFSWFNMVTNNPPTIYFTCNHNPDGRLKDTASNVKTTKQFVVNIISEAWVAQANTTSINAPPEVSEWPLSGLTKAPSLHIKPARVKESAFSMECELLQEIELVNPENGTCASTMFLGHVKYIHVRKDVLNERGLVDPGKLRPVTRMGDISYGRVTEGYRIPRPDYEATKDDIKAALENNASA